MAHISKKKVRSENINGAKLPLKIFVAKSGHVTQIKRTKAVFEHASELFMISNAKSYKCPVAVHILN